jgi:ankyrin repeat protein
MSERDQLVLLRFANRNGKLRLVKQLLRISPQLEQMKLDGTTWLHDAATSGNVKLVEFWLDRGHDVNQNIPGYSKTDGLNTPLHHAANTAVTRCLLSHGANINAWSRYGGTPLHGAVVTKDPSQAKLLLEHGADASIEDRDGRTPMALAEYLHRTSVERPLRAANAALVGKKPPKQRVPRSQRSIDLRRDVTRITKALLKALRRFARQHADELVTAISIAVSGIEGYAIVAIDNKPYISPWDATFHEYDTQVFKHWRYGWELSEDGMTLTDADGKLVRWSREVSDRTFERPFFSAAIAALQLAEKQGAFERVNRAAALTLGVQAPLGGHARAWKAKRPR